jgi:hypothetical protein
MCYHAQLTDDFLMVKNFVEKNPSKGGKGGYVSDVKVRGPVAEVKDDF